MSVALPVLAVLIALVGHAALWAGFVNRVHATGAPRFLVKSLSGAGHAMLVVGPPVAAWYWSDAGGSIHDWAAIATTPGPAWFYFIPCWLSAAAVTAIWVRRHLLRKPPAQLLTNRSTTVDVAEQLGRKPLHGIRANLLSLVPGNEVLRISVEVKEFEIARLPASLDGFSIVLLSDWHLTGRIGLEYFQEVIRQANALQPDLIALCGDLVEDALHFDWIPETFAKLRARHGVYFVLGNHDLFTRDVRRLRQMLAEAGLTDLSGRWKRLEIADAEIIVAGNELPWFTPAADMEHCGGRTPDCQQLRILLSHSPDQFGWARRWDFDLMLAGHTHGGQIRLPIVGPIFSPSRHGVKYASGTFYAKPTLMHVSRGISSELPIRLNCPPELSKLVLRCPPL